MSGSLKRRDDRHDPGPIEVSFMVLSALLVVGLFGFTIYQGVVAPESPRLTVEVTKVEPVGDEVLVTIELHNDGAFGFRSVTVSVDCDTPPPEVTLENVPAGGRRAATLTCPAETTDPQASVSSRVPV